MKSFEEVFVESSVSGRFKRMLYEIDGDGQRIRTGPRYEDDEERAHRNSPRALRSMVLHAAYVLDAFFLLSQGIFSGAALMQLIIVLQISSEDTLLQVTLRSPWKSAHFLLFGCPQLCRCIPKVFGGSRRRRPVDDAPA